jgi:CBS domain-containing protein
VELYFAIYFFFFVASGNLLLAVFNLFPGYPLDGGRVLRAIVWKRTGNMREATRIAGFCGQLIALILIAFGIYMAVAPTFRAYFMGLWAVMVGVFLLGAATSVVKSARGPATVRDAMAAPIAVEPDLTVQSFVDELLPLHRQATFPVARDRKLLGILLLEDLKKLPRDQWRTRRTREVMRPVNSSMFVPASATMASARELMQRNGVGAVAVINERYDLIGFVRQKLAKGQKSSRT